jgi:hypothetical protein
VHRRTTYLDRSVLVVATNCSSSFVRLPSQRPVVAVQPRTASGLAQTARAGDGPSRRSSQAGTEGLITHNIGYRKAAITSCRHRSSIGAQSSFGHSRVTRSMRAPAETYSWTRSRIC